MSDSSSASGSRPVMSRALFARELRVANVGLASFADSIIAAGGTVTPIDWRPPAEGDEAAGRSLAALVGDAKVEAANATAFGRFLVSRPVLRSAATAAQVLPGMDGRTILHAGPPVGWEQMCGPMQGAVVGAVLLEGWADDPHAARSLASSGAVAFAPCHERGAVGPMAGIVSPSMPVWVVDDVEHGTCSFSNLNEGLGKVLRFGAYDDEVLDRLRWMTRELLPALAAALDMLGGVELKPLIAQALHMGDECHNRNVAASSLLFRRLVPALADRGAPVDVLRFLAGNDHFFLNVSMAACKAMLDAAHGVPRSTLVTAMARNGVEFGIRLSGTGQEWFTAPAPTVDGLFFAGFGVDDAAPDLGDSTITETAGLGGFAMAAAPAIVQFVGGSPADALACSREMAAVTMGVNEAFTLPTLGFAPGPAGIDARRVADTGVAPVINTGIAHRDPGVGQVGAGITRAPLSCFSQAVSCLAATPPA